MPPKETQRPTIAAATAAVLLCVLAGSRAHAQDGATYNGAVIAILEHIQWPIILILAVVALMYALMKDRDATAARAAIRWQFRLFETAVSNMSQGLTMFGADGRMIYCNDRYLEIYGLSRVAVQPGITLDELLRLRKESGTLDIEPSTFAARFESEIKADGTTQVVADLPDGRSILVSYRVLPEGGWLTTHDDISEFRKLQKEVLTTTSFLQSVIDNIPTCVVVRNIGDNTYKLVNRAFETFNNITREKIVGRVPDDIYPQETIDATADLDRRALASSEGTAEREELLPFATGMRTISNRRVVIRGEEGKPEFMLALFEDVSVRTELAKELENTKRFLESVVNNIPVSVIVKRVSDDRFILINRETEDVIGIPCQDIIGKTISDFFPENAAKIFKARDDAAVACSGDVYSGVYPVKHPTRGMRMFAGRRVAVMNDAGDAEYVIITQEDITERRQNESKIVHMAYHDALTRLPNRAAFSQSLSQMIDASQSDSAEFAVLSIDIDRFKEINDVFGHAFGDKLLVAMAKTIQIASQGAVVARLSGDEFGLIIDGPQPEAGRALAERIRNALRDEFEIDGKALRVGLTCGISLYPRDGKDPASLLANADVALYRAKVEARGSVRVFEPEMDQQTRDRRALHLDLVHAIENRQLSLYYQPLIHTDSQNEVIGFEALVRWHHPVRGFVSPGVFIPIAEESGLIVEMGEWILRAACMEAASWKKPLQIAVNLSPVQFLHGDLVGLVHSILLETGLAPSRLELEITEGVLIRDFDRGVALLRRLKALGVRISMDDFGTGYSSLSYLQSFPFDKIKIDRAFVMNIGRNAQSAAIIRAIINLGHGLNVPIVAEGVETEAQRAFLVAEKCDQLQGFLLGKPAPILSYAEIVGREKPVDQPKLIGARAG
jgi:diguanylate cyclase (GGDEF)-like protein/PAS domain S-box-containing protein